MKKRKIPIIFYISAAVLLITSAMLVASRRSVSVANAINAQIASPYRRLMADFAELFSFSLFELIVVLSPVIVGLIIWRLVVVFKRGYGRTRLVCTILSIAFLLYSGNTLALGIAYNTTSVDYYLGLPSVKVEESALYDAMKELCLEVNVLSEKIEYSDGKSYSGRTLAGTSEEICNSYYRVAEKYGYPDAFTSHAKSVSALHFMSYLSLGGIYTYYTGEANVNTDYPEYDVTFTAAHELAHQRGVLRENEANFMAYLVLSESDDDYLKYSAALNMLSYVGTALWRTNPDAYYEIMAQLSAGAISDIRASRAVSAKYGDTIFSDISNLVNDLFLKSNGTDGVVTYGRVVTLYMSYREVK